MSNQTDTWYSYECHEGCYPPTGVIVDVRLPNGLDEALKVKCPICGVPLDFRGRWKATEGGYGSGGDCPPLVLFPRFFEDMAQRMAENLTNAGLTHTHEQFDQAIAVLTKQLHFQHNLHLSWQDGDEDSAVRIRMDKP